MSAWGCPHEIDGVCQRVLGALCWGWVFASVGAGAPFLFAGFALLGALALFVVGSRVLLPQA